VLTDSVTAWAERLVAALRAQHLVHYVAVFVPTELGDGLVLAAQHWGSGHVNGAVIAGSVTVPLVGSVVGRVFRTGSPSLVSDTLHDPEYRDFPGGANRSELAVPIVVDGQTVGVLNLEHPRVGTYGIADLDRVQAILAESVRDYPVAVTGNGH
jgi:putative methionine-R-sulfoxide reductase with GAF domain